MPEWPAGIENPHPHILRALPLSAHDDHHQAEDSMLSAYRQLEADNQALLTLRDAARIVAQAGCESNNGGPLVCFVDFPDDMACWPCVLGAALDSLPAHLKEA